MSKIFDLIEQENQRQVDGLEMIPSENYVSADVRKALGSVLTNKYSEGFPKSRYYGGNQVIDQIEEYTIDLAKKLFSVEDAIVQAYSGSPANLAAMMAVAKPGDTIMGLSVQDGGHLTHGAAVSFSGQLFHPVHFHLGQDHRVDFETSLQTALEHKPTIIWAGITAYPYQIEFAKYRQIADQVGAWLIADISHVAGLVVTGQHPDPVDFADIITTTTHKTLRGPRGALIMVTKRGLAKDPELTHKLQKAIFPGLQGGPHNHQTAAIGIALEEANRPDFTTYAKQVIQNAKALANELETDTENHLLLLDLTKYGFGMGYQAQIALEAAGITVNKNTIPQDPASPYYPSGIRLGTPALTTRGMVESDMVKIASFIKRVLAEIIDNDLPLDQASRRDFIKQFRVKIDSNPEIKKIAEEVRLFAKQFPTP